MFGWPQGVIYNQSAAPLSLGYLYLRGASSMLFRQSDKDDNPKAMSVFALLIPV